jgi:hypothetical protein
MQQPIIVNLYTTIIMADQWILTGDNKVCLLHHVDWICIHTDEGNQIVALAPLPRGPNGEIRLRRQQAMELDILNGVPVPTGAIINLVNEDGSPIIVDTEH